MSAHPLEFAQRRPAQRHSDQHQGGVTDGILLASALDSTDSPDYPAAATQQDQTGSEAMPGDPTVDTPAPPSPSLDDEETPRGVDIPSGSDDTPATTEPARGQQYTYHDGDAERTVWLKPRTPNPVGDDPGDPLDPVGGSDAGGLVFVDESGNEMTLPGGVLLSLDAAWNSSEVWEFFGNNGISSSDVTELEWLDNGFFIDTERGLASLELANELAAQDGVDFASPNWATVVRYE